MSTKQILAILAFAAFAGTAGLTVMATGGESPDEPGFLQRHVHALGQHLHGGGHHEQPMAELIEQLDLNPEQRRRFDRVHEVLGSVGAEHAASMRELHGQLMAEYEQDRMEPETIRPIIDVHVERMRETIYAATDEMISLVNSLDARQRQILLEHFQQMHEGRHGHG